MKSKSQLYAIVCLTALSMLFGLQVAEAKQPVKHHAVASIPVIGKTADGKYPVYALKGDTDDTTYFAAGKAWSSADLLTRMVFIDPVDAKSGKYHCDWICKDGFQNVVGLNPANKFLMPK